MARTFYQNKTYVFRSSLEVVPDIFSLPRIGAGHDGYVFRFNNKALKLLKYDISLRKEKRLMTFTKAVYFQDELDLKRFAKPTDILLDEEGVYSGYVMDYLEDVTSEDKKDLPIHRSIVDFTCGELVHTANQLEEDFVELSRKKVLALDINSGSYIYTTDFIKLCDMDKYQISDRDVTERNKSMLNYVIAKYLYYAMELSDSLDKEQLKRINAWVKKMTNSRQFIGSLEKEIGRSYSTPIREYAKHKVKSIIK